MKQSQQPDGRPYCAARHVAPGTARLQSQQFAGYVSPVADTQGSSTGLGPGCTWVIRSGETMSQKQPVGPELTIGWAMHLPTAIAPWAPLQGHTP